MSLEIHSMLSKETIEIGKGNKDFFTNPFIIHYESKATQCFHNMQKVQKYCPEADQGGHASWVLSLDIISAYCHILEAKRHHCFIHLDRIGKTNQF